LKALLSFFTVLPVRNPSLEEAAREVRLLPLIGLVTGLPGAFLLLTAFVLPPSVAAILALGAVLLAAGLHHADGVLDVGDALMAHGGRDRRREVLSDARVGIGGLGALFLVYAPTVAALAALCAHSPGRATLALFAGEVASRSAMLLTLAFGEPADARSSVVPFVKALTGPRHTGAVVVALLAPLPFLLATSALAPLAILTAPLVAWGVIRIAAARFGGIGGDVVGAGGEACRAALLVLLSATM
jgi:adenosylcobinamide-GDP ribazoletransferase